METIQGFMETMETSGVLDFIKVDMNLVQDENYESCLILLTYGKSVSLVHI